MAFLHFECKSVGQHWCTCDFFVMNIEPLNGNHITFCLYAFVFFSSHLLHSNTLSLSVLFRCVLIFEGASVVFLLLIQFKTNDILSDCVFSLLFCCCCFYFVSFTFSAHKVEGVELVSSTKFIFIPDTEMRTNVEYWLASGLMY